MSANKDLAAWLTYLETLHPKIIDLGRARIRQVAEQANLLPVPYFVITVAGTNGKGTSVALLEAVFLAAGYRVGSYTSPHLLHYNERIKINGVPVSDIDLCTAFNFLEQVRGNTTLTYFEFGTLAALWLFKQQPLDVVILEVGLGGRLDAVNIVDADIALISTIALDHMEYLGDNREAIGKEKAGIMRSHKPVVCGDFNLPQSVLDYAQAINAILYAQNKDFFYQQDSEKSWRWHNRNKEFINLPVPAIPLQNAATVLQVLAALPLSFTISEENIHAALQRVKVPGRFQEFRYKNISCIFDVAHNPAAATWLAEKLATMPIIGRTIAVIGMLGDKDHIGTVQPLSKIVSAWFVGGLTGARGLSGQSLAEKLLASGINNVTAFNSVCDAFENALQVAEPDDRIIVFGSFHTIEAVMQMNDVK